MANTTNLNLVKPSGTDYALVSVINGNMDIIDSKVGAIPANESAQSQITALNNQITSIETVSSNIAFTNETGYAHTLFIRKINKVVYINGYIGATNAFGDGDFVGTIESGSRPGGSVRVPIAIASAAYLPGDIGYLTIGTSGKVYITAKSGNTNKVAYFSISYVAEN